MDLVSCGKSQASCFLVFSLYAKTKLKSCWWQLHISHKHISQNFKTIFIYFLLNSKLAEKATYQKMFQFQKRICFKRLLINPVRLVKTQGKNLSQSIF